MIKMIIKKTAELFFKTNDIYILETFDNTIIINNNHQGLLILNDSLDIQKEVHIQQIAPIYFVYKKYDNSALMLYLPDAHQTILIDLKTCNHDIITLPEVFHEEILSSNYYWNNDTFILTTTNDAFYEINFISKILYALSYKKVQRNYPSFYDFWNICKHYNIVTIYPEKESFIFQKDDHHMGFFNGKNDQECEIKEYFNDWHDIEYKNNLFCFIDEHELKIIHDNNTFSLYPQNNFIFLKAKFLGDNNLAILSSNPANCQESLLEVYKT